MTEKEQNLADKILDKAIEATDKNVAYLGELIEHYRLLTEASQNRASVDHCEIETFQAIENPGLCEDCETYD